MKIGFIGCGNMAQPIIRGMAKSAVKQPSDIFVTDVRRDALNAFCMEQGVTASTQAEILDKCSCIVLAVKPQVLPDVLPTLADKVNSRHIFVISIAAGKNTAYLSSFFNKDIPVARIFPNLNAKVNAAVSAYCGNGQVSEEQFAFVQRCCESFGFAYRVPEEQIAIFGVLGGCAPAYTFLYINALATAAKEAGLDAAIADDVAAKMAEGSAKLLVNSSDTAEELVKKVCSPGGTTIEGVRSLQQAHFKEVLQGAFQASLMRDKELSK